MLLRCFLLATTTCYIVPVLTLVSGRGSTAGCPPTSTVTGQRLTCGLAGLWLGTAKIFINPKGKLFFSSSVRCFCFSKVLHNSFLIR